MNNNKMYICNMIFTKKEILDKYCEWLFSFLLEATDNIDITTMNAMQQRVAGYYGEVMLTVWLNKQQYQIYDMPILNI